MATLQSIWQTEFAGQLATWLSAIGTIAAVVVALYLARARDRITLRLHAYTILLFSPGNDEVPEFVSIEVTNVGRRTATVSQIGWRFGVLRKRHAVQIAETTPELWSFGLE